MNNSQDDRQKWAWIFDPPPKGDDGSEDERYMAQKNLALHLDGRRHYGQRRVPNPECIRCQRSLARLEGAMA